jgi:hypothetical protein
VDAAEGEEGQGQVKKTATEAQIAGWTRALVTLAQASLPRDHPLCSVGPGRYPYETHQKAAYAALKQMAAHGVTPPSEDEIRRLAEDGVDIEEHRTRERTLREVYTLRDALAHAHRLSMAELTALAEALRSAVDRMRAALPETEKKP